jgi:hypothetical protein
MVWIQLLLIRSRTTNFYYQSGSLPNIGFNLILKCNGKILVPSKKIITLFWFPRSNNIRSKAISHLKKIPSHLSSQHRLICKFTQRCKWVYLKICVYQITFLIKNLFLMLATPLHKWCKSSVLVHKDFTQGLIWAK